MLIRAATIFAGLCVLWQAVVWLSGAQPWILPGPATVAVTLIANLELIAGHAWVTLAEIVLGLLLGCCLGALSALVMIRYAPLGRWMLPVMVVSQAVPVFALAPVLVLWLGYGMASKVAMAVLIIYFPVTAAFHDGLRRTHPGWLDLAHTLGASPYATLRHVRLPAALPAFGSGVRVATAVAPIGAVVGEWVGSSAGLGHLMLLANGRMKVDLMFAALAVLAVMAVLLYTGVDRALRRLTAWQPESALHERRYTSIDAEE
jgi:putative hydroxymethylpyrimidine transport system permease protein